MLPPGTIKLSLISTARAKCYSLPPVCGNYSITSTRKSNLVLSFFLTERRAFSWLALEAVKFQD